MIKVKDLKQTHIGRNVVWNYPVVGEIGTFQRRYGRIRDWNHAGGIIFVVFYGNDKDKYDNYMKHHGDACLAEHLDWDEGVTCFVEHARPERKIRMNLK